KRRSKLSAQIVEQQWFERFHFKPQTSFSMASVYILYSESSNKFYVGYTTETVAKRLEKHNSGFYEHKYTARGKPFEDN
ncbi:MAG TPA: GIY-YIG nuclease family protein, partial [Chitinophagales bacterium]|nr:GIY-YIG nuclease family protein [Chitinophagales bacterium]